ncbi:MAG: ribonuclease III [Pseudomonadota bacterium]|nr:ribonuclease III [Pseudomonadota bacterium]
MSNFINYTFNNKNLLNIALTHRSLGDKNNERLEYLGDAILGFVIAEYIYNKFSHSAEGELTRLRASLVKKEKLAEIARDISLEKEVKLGSGELKSGGWQRDSILANTLEALIGAIYLDSDIKKCRSFILTIYHKHLEIIDPENIRKDPKSRLQEYLQSRKKPTPIYEVINEKGSSHKPEFTISCKVDLLDDLIIATGSSKQKAEQAVATKILNKLQNSK